MSSEQMGFLICFWDVSLERVSDKMIISDAWLMRDKADMNARLTETAVAMLGLKQWHLSRQNPALSSFASIWQRCMQE